DPISMPILSECIHAAVRVRVRPLRPSIRADREDRSGSAALSLVRVGRGREADQRVGVHSQGRWLVQGPLRSEVRFVWKERVLVVLGDHEDRRYQDGEPQGGEHGGPGPRDTGHRGREVTTQVIDGAALARTWNQAVAEKARALARPPGLAVVLVGTDP